MYKLFHAFLIVKVLMLLEVNFLAIKTAIKMVLGVPFLVTHHVFCKQANEILNNKDFIRNADIDKEAHRGQSPNLTKLMGRCILSPPQSLSVVRFVRPASWETRMIWPAPAPPSGPCRLIPWFWTTPNLLNFWRLWQRTWCDHFTGSGEDSIKSV